jgi:glycopeptide antibiotics resistance protein
MVRLLAIGIECLSALVFLVPAMVILNTIFLKQHSLGKNMMSFIFALYSMAIFSAVGLPALDTICIDFKFNIIPIIDILNDPIAYIKNTVLNIILFIPMGFLLPVIWREYRSMKRTVFMGFAISIMIECMQIFTFRLTDIDDLITNILGTILGYYLGKKFSCKLSSKLSEDTRGIPMIYEPVIILLIVFLIGFLLKPVVSNKIWEALLSSSLWESIE